MRRRAVLVVEYEKEPNTSAPMTAQEIEYALCHGHLNVQRAWVEIKEDEALPRG